MCHLVGREQLQGRVYAPTTDSWANKESNRLHCCRFPSSMETQREYRQGMSLKAFIWAECNDRKQIDSMIA